MGQKDTASLQPLTRCKRGSNIIVKSAIMLLLYQLFSQINASTAFLSNFNGGNMAFNLETTIVP